MPDKVFSITGNKISSLVIDETSLKFSSQSFKTTEEFQNAWKKKVSLATKVEVKYDAIKSIKKEDNDKNISIRYKTWAGIPGNCEFAFLTEEDYEVLFNFLEKERYFTRMQETLTPFRAIRNYSFGLIAAIGFTIFCFYEAIDIENGTAPQATNGKTRVFNFLLEQLGHVGVIAVGSLGVCFLLYKIWMRFSNPPNQVKLLPHIA